VAADPIVQPTTTERPAAASDPRPRARPETSPTTPVTRTTPPTVATQTPAPAAASPFEEGRRAFLAQNFSAAIQAFEQVTRETPGNAEAHKQLARSLMRAGQVPRAVTEYRRYLELSPNAADRTVIESIIEQNSH
jgi:Flp pilus assembly protein TadD